MADKIEIDDHIIIKDRGDERQVPDSGRALYVNNGELKTVSSDGERSGVSDNPTFDSLTTDVLNNGGPISDGDGVERQVWVIENGASDPTEAAPEDIIFEKEV